MVQLRGNPDKAFGVGLYTPSEAARLARVRPQTLNRWLYGNRQGEAVVQPRFSDSGEERVVTFWDLIQAVTIRQLRNNSNVSLPHIREVVEQAQREFQIEYPFARRHTLYVFDRRLILRLGEEQYVGLTSGIDRGQLYHHRIIEPFLCELTFDDNEMAQVWTPLSSGSGNFRVTLDSNRRFGMPTIQPKGVLVSALTNAVHSEGSIEAAAEAYETEVEAVQLAVKYSYDYLDPAA